MTFSRGNILRIEAVGRVIYDRRVEALGVDQTKTEAHHAYKAAFQAWRPQLEELLAGEEPELVIRWKRGEGLIVYGDGTRTYKDRIKSLGSRRWRFSKNIDVDGEDVGGAWYVPGSRDRDHPPMALENALRELRKAGTSVRLDRVEGGAKRSAADKLADQVARGERRADRLDRAGDRRLADSKQRYDSAKKELNVIPLGQPVIGQRDARRRRKLGERLDRSFQIDREGKAYKAAASRAAQKSEFRATDVGYARRKLDEAQRLVREHQRQASDSDANRERLEGLLVDVAFWEDEVKRREGGRTRPEDVEIGDLLNRQVVVAKSKKSARVWSPGVKHFPWDEYEGYKLRFDGVSKAEILSHEQRTENLRKAYTSLADRAAHHDRPKKEASWRRKLERL